MNSERTLAEFETVRQEIDRLHQQLASGHAIHLPTYHRTMKQCEATVTAIVSQRQPGTILRPSQRARQCIGKRRYTTVESALAGRPQVDREDYETYRCVFCSFVHVGHKRQPVKSAEVRS